MTSETYEERAFDAENKVQRLTALAKELAEALKYAQRCVHGEYRKPIDAALQKYKEQQS